MSGRTLFIGFQRGASIGLTRRVASGKNSVYGNFQGWQKSLVGGSSSRWFSANADDSRFDQKKTI
tara:strand:- start:448 stop:642 length:195 start_codon:yes stop_codon:yes gene_type:complete